MTAICNVTQIYGKLKQTPYQVFLDTKVYTSSIVYEDWQKYFLTRQSHRISSSVNK